jgi:pyruvate/2-oxoglutarate dehydrogenase complex dihydrolipoamide acyltransferase (E2) component
MATELVMPKLGAKMNEGMIIEWKKIVSIIVSDTP